MTQDYRDRFGLTDHPFTKHFLHEHHVAGKSFTQFEKRFEWSLGERGVAVLTGKSGVGKTAVLHALTRRLPPHQYRVLYIEDSQAGINDIYRSLAYAMGLEPAFRRSALWRQLKTHIIKMNDENDQQVVLIIDDAHRLPTAFLESLSAFMNFMFDSRDLLTIWLVGDSHLVRTLELASHRHLKTRLRLGYHLDAMTREELVHYVRETLSNAGCTRQICSDTALDAVYQISQGIPRTAGKLLSMALRIADEQNRDIICDQVIDQARQEVLL